MNCKVALMLLLASLASCSGPSWVQNPIASEPRQYRVGLEHHVKGGETVELGYDHPQTLEATELEFLLIELEYSEPRLVGKDKVRVAFQPYEAARLAPALAEVLAKADPDSRIWFTSYNKGDGGSVVGERRETAGVLFLDPAGVLNIAFGHINEVPAFDDELQSTRPTQAYHDPAENTSSTTPLIPRDWYSIKISADGTERQLWAVVKLNELREARGVTVEPSEKPEATVEESAEQAG